MEDKIGGSDFVKFLPNDEEPQVGAIYSIVGLGHIESQKYQSTETEFKNQIMLFIELCFDRYVFPDGIEKPLVVNARMTRSLDERAKLYGLIKGFRGLKFMTDNKSIDWSEFMGNLAFVSLENKDSKDGKKTYTNLLSMTRVPKGIQMPKSLFNNKVMFDITMIKPDWEAFIQLYPWVQKIIMSSTEWQELDGQGKIPKIVFESMAEEEGSKPAEVPKDKMADKDDDSAFDIPAKKIPQSAPRKAQEMETREEDEDEDDEDPFSNQGSEDDDNEFGSVPTL